MSTKPFPYQRECALEVEGFDGRALIVLSPGLGKSLISLLWAKWNPEARPILIVCPAHLKYNWQNECKKHFGWDSTVLEGRTPSPLTGGPGIWIINYDVVRDWEKELVKLAPKLAILDEAVAIQNTAAARSRAVRSVCRGVPHVLPMTGTPITTRPANIWHSMHIVRPERYAFFRPWAQRFCLPADAPVLMGDLTERPISEIKVGDTVIGWRRENGRRRLARVSVLDTIQKKSPLQKVTLSNGDTLICTPDHKWATGRKGVEYREARTGRSNGKGGRGTASCILKIMAMPKPPRPKTDDYKLGYIHGFWRGDGHCIKNTLTKTYPFRDGTKKESSKHTIGCACNDSEAIDRLHDYLDYFQIPHRRYVRSDALHAITMGNTLSYKFITEETVKNSNDWWAGFLGGIYDAEGSGQIIAQDQRANSRTYRMIETALTRFGFSYGATIDGKGWRLRGGRQEIIRLWDVADPVMRRKLVSYIMNAGGKFSGGDLSTGKGSFHVKNIQPLPGEHHDVYTLTTETGNYVAYGYGSKNCDPKFTAYGWKFDGASNLPELHRQLKRDGMVRRRKCDVLKDLPDKIRSVVPLPLDNYRQYEKARDKFLAWLQEHKPERLHKSIKAQAVTQLGYLKRLAAELKVPSVMEWLDDRLACEDKVILFGIHKPVLSALLARYKKRCVFVDGSVPARRRQEAFDRFQTDGGINLFLGNIQAAGTGWNGTVATTVAFCELGWTWAEHEQAEDRGHRIGQVNALNCVYLVARGTLEEDICRIIQSRQGHQADILDGGDSGDRADIFDQLTSLIGESSPRKRRRKV